MQMLIFILYCFYQLLELIANLIIMFDFESGLACLTAFLKIELGDLVFLLAGMTLFSGIEIEVE